VDLQLIFVASAAIIPANAGISLSRLQAIEWPGLDPAFFFERRVKIFARM
jgi:hypothetical protein